MQVQPYLFFDGRCEEALEFYKSKLGAKLEIADRFGVSWMVVVQPQNSSARS